MTRGGDLDRLGVVISIHALREEGDVLYVGGNWDNGSFLSTPSARRATYAIKQILLFVLISIHALREEGDSYFLAQAGLSKIFLSTPSARRAT